MDVEVTVEPLGLHPDDLISLTVNTADAVSGRDGFLFHYSASAGIVQMPPFGGQFPAPAQFRQAMEPFLAQP